jgi:hypothetical protein
VRFEVDALQPEEGVNSKQALWLGDLESLNDREHASSQDVVMNERTGQVDGISIHIGIVLSHGKWWEIFRGERLLSHADIDAPERPSVDYGRRGNNLKENLRP